MEHINEKAKEIYPDRMGGLDQSSVDRYRAGYIKGYKDAFEQQPSLSEVEMKQQWYGYALSLGIKINDLQSLRAMWKEEQQSASPPSLSHYEQLLEDLDDKRILKFSNLQSDMWYFSRKHVAEALLDKYDITLKPSNKK